MKKSLILISLCLLCLASYAQVSKGESLLGGTIKAYFPGGKDYMLGVIPEYKYAISNKDLLGLSVGFTRMNELTTEYLVGPNYTRMFSLSENIFVLLSGYAHTTIRDVNYFVCGVFPGLGYRLNQRFLVTLRNEGIYYHDTRNDISMNMGLNSLSINAYCKIGR